MIQFRTKVSGCLLCAVLCLGLLAGCTGTEEPSVSEPGSETVSQLPEESSQPAENGTESGSDSEPDTPETVSVTGYLFDQQMILDEMNRSLEQYSQLSPEAELFPQRSVEVMRMTQEQFEKMAALTPPEGYEEIVPLAEGAASTMEEVTSLVEQAFAAGLDTQEGAGLLTQAQGKFSGAVDALEEITALLSRNPDELLSGNTTE